MTAVEAVTTRGNSVRFCIAIMYLHCSKEPVSIATFLQSLAQSYQLLCLTDYPYKVTSSKP